MKRWDEFLRLATLETDDCIVWPYAKYVSGHGMVSRHGRKVRTHRVALAQRQPPPFSGAMALHGPCHDAACMNYRHLYWGTQIENQADRLRDGTSNRGSRHGMARLTDAQVEAIRRAVGTQREIARRYGVTQPTVSRIRLRRTWV